MPSQGDRWCLHYTSGGEDKHVEFEYDETFDNFESTDSEVPAEISDGPFGWQLDVNGQVFTLTSGTGPAGTYGGRFIFTEGPCPGSDSSDISHSGSGSDPFEDDPFSSDSSASSGGSDESSNESSESEESSSEESSGSSEYSSSESPKVDSSVSESSESEELPQSIQVTIDGETVTLTLDENGVYTSEDSTITVTFDDIFNNEWLMQDENGDTWTGGNDPDDPTGTYDADVLNEAFGDAVVVAA